MKQGMKVQPVFIDVRTEAGQVFKTYLEGRNAKTADKVQQQIE